ncbi:MAG: hypothetical protein OEV40_24250 [Acidimicrobiia bacterium]|nr:hypothetical protein [Acidimicrobiia bacterium]
MATLNIIQVRCIDRQDRVGPDKFSVYIDGRKHAGEFTIGADETLLLNTAYEFQGRADVELWEEDSGTGNDDKLGGFWAEEGEIGDGELEKSFSFARRGDYNMWYEVKA